MMRLSNRKLRILISLCLATIALLIGLLFYLPHGINNAAGIPDQDEEHNRSRTAQISLNPSLSWELELKGSGEETVVASFVSDGYLYVFGNTASSDLDFDRAGIFLSIVDVFGIIKAFFVYGETGDILRSACLCEGGFLLAVEGDSGPKLVVVDYTGLTIKTISGFFYGFERVVNIKYYNGGYLLFSQAENILTEVRTLRCSYFTDNLQFASSSIAVSPYSLDLFDSVVISGRAVAICNASSTLHTVPAIVEFSQTQPVKINIFQEYSGRVAGFSVYDGDFLLLTTEGGSSLIRISIAYEIKTKTNLSQLTALGLSEAGSGDLGVTQAYLVFVDSAAYIVDGSGNRKSTLPAFIPKTRAYLFDLVAYAGFAGGTVTLNVYSDQKIIFAANLGEGENPAVALDQNNIFCIYQRDGNVQISKLRYPLFW